jgi:2',3'-cyclic-nucleotide 2'-phosphodiesterase (5'-nucleotidase family)
VAIVDAGNLFFKKDQLSPGVTSEIAAVTAEIILDAFNEIGCDAFSPGSQDFALGLDFLLKMEKNANFPFISANIKDITGLRLFRPYQIVSKGGINIGFIGLASQFTHPDLLIDNPIKALEGIIDEVSNQVDLVVLLFNSEERDILELQRSDLPIDMVYRSKSRKRSNDGGSKTIPVYSAGDRGKYLYDVTIAVNDKSLKFVDITAQENALQNATQRLDRMRKNHPEGTDLKTIFKDDPQTLARINNYERQVDEANYALENAINSFTLTKHELNKKIIDKPEILKIVDKGKEKINFLGGPLIDSQGRLPSDAHHGHKH